MIILIKTRVSKSVTMIVFTVSELLSMVFLNKSNGVDDIQRSYLLYLGQTQCFNNSSTYSLHQVTLNSVVHGAQCPTYNF